MFGVLYNESGGSKTPLHFKLGFTFFFIITPELFHSVHHIAQEIKSLRAHSFMWKDPYF